MAKIKARRSQPSKIQRFLAHDPQTLATILALAIVGVAIGLITLVPSTQPFEGSLVVYQLGFTSSQSGQLLLNTVGPLQKLSGSGQQDSFILYGPFISKMEPRLNKLSELKIRLPNASSRWTIEPVTLQDIPAPAAGKPPLIPPDLVQDSRLVLKQLALQENDQVSKLKYDPLSRTLSFVLKQGVAPSAPDQLELKPGAPLKITLQDYELSNLQGTPDRLELIVLEPLEFFPLASTTLLSLQFPPGKQPALWGDLAVKQVELTDVQQNSSDFTNNILESTILSGKVRMSDRQLDLQAHQFLRINGEWQNLPGIETLLRLKVTEPEKTLAKTDADTAAKTEELEQPQGLQVDISGHARTLEVGLNYRLPVTRIQATLIERWFPKDIAIAVISFLSAIFASLIGLLINRFLTKPSSGS
ncbi:MAG: hypothetical protein ACKO24_12835 [Leptolyngbyaceae cyanobacterium]